MASPAPAAESLRALVFVTLAGKRYALSASAVREVLPLVEPVPVPGWPADALGLADVRGELMPLVDLARFLGLRPRPLRPDHYVLVLTGDGRPWGVVAEAVDSVQMAEVLAADRLELPEAYAAAPLCSGVCMREEGPVLVLDAPAVLEALRLPPLPPPPAGGGGP